MLCGCHLEIPNMFFSNAFAFCTGLAYDVAGPGSVGAGRLCSGLNSVSWGVRGYPVSDGQTGEVRLFTSQGEEKKSHQA
jgi:hypothetical protein